MAGEQGDSASVKYNYDVFFSFSHQDLNSTNHLYTALVDAGFRTFRDGDPIERSADIKSEVRKAIDRSKCCVIVLSKAYASSKWCLDQLVMIVEGKKKNLILPIFYEVDPVEVGSQIGRIGEAFARFEDQFKVEADPQIQKNLMDKIEEWSEALSFAADVQGFMLQNLAQGTPTEPGSLKSSFTSNRDESMLIKVILEAVEEKVKAVEEDFFRMEAEIEGELLNQEEPSSLVEEWSAAVISLMNIEELPENPKCPVLVKLLFQQSYDLTEIPDSFFESMPILQVLDLSNTSIKTLPRSIASLLELRQFFLRGCVLLTELPPEIGELRNLEVFDLEGTELIYLPKEIGRLLKLECFKVSLYRCPKNYIERRDIEAIIPRATVSKFYHLKELGILVDPDCEWWDAEVEAIIEELPQLRNLGTLKLYFPTLELLEKFLQLPSNVYRNLSNFRLTVGRHEHHIISSLPHGLQRNFKKLDKCLIYVNGKGNVDGIGKALEHARALFLDRQWTMEKLSEFKIDEMHHLNFCLVVECNEMKTIVDGGDFYQEGDNGGKPVLESLCYLSVYYMKNLRSIWRGPFVNHCLSCLEILALHTCPELTTIFNMALLHNLINLKELIVENCPKVKILVDADPSLLEVDSYFLPALKKILVVDLPELVSISGGLRIGPKLESIFFSNCPMLKNLSHMDMCSKYMHEIKDESEWLNELDSSSSEIDYLQLVFPVTSYDDFAKQIILKQGTGIEGLIPSKDVVEEDKVDAYVTELESVNVNYSSHELELYSSHKVDWSWVPKPTKNLEISLPCSLVQLRLVDCNLDDDAFPLDLSSLHSLKELNLSRNSFTKLPECTKYLDMLKHLHLDGCHELLSLPELPASLTELDVIDCRSLERLELMPDAEKNSLLPLKMRLYGCKKLVEVDCMFVLEPIENFNPELMNGWGLDYLESMGNVVVELCNNLTHTRMKCPVQGLYEFGIFSSFLPLDKIPSVFSCKSLGTSISFTVPLSHNLKLRAINVCVGYARSSEHKHNHFYDFHMKVSNKTKDLEWTYGPTFYGNGDAMMWLSRWDITGGIEGGDEVNVLVTVGLGFQVKECGINLVYEEEGQAIQNGMYPSYLSALGDVDTYILSHYDMRISRAAYNGFFDRDKSSARNSASNLSQQNECTIVTTDSQLNFNPPVFPLITYFRRNLPYRTTSQLISRMTRRALRLFAL